MEDNSHPKEHKRGLNPLLISIPCFFILFAASLLSISWLSALYLFAACLCFSGALASKAFLFLAVYSFLVLLAKVAALILAHTTDFFADLSPFQKDLVHAIGFELISGNVAKIILSLLADVLVTIGLIIFNRLGRNQEVPEAAPKRVLLCHLWYWIAVGLLGGIYLLGVSLCYLITSSKC